MLYFTAVTISWKQKHSDVFSPCVSTNKKISTWMRRIWEVKNTSTVCWNPNVLYSPAADGTNCLTDKIHKTVLCRKDHWGIWTTVGLSVGQLALAWSCKSAAKLLKITGKKLFWLQSQARLNILMFIPDGELQENCWLWDCLQETGWRGWRAERNFYYCSYLHFSLFYLPLTSKFPVPFYYLTLHTS